MKKYLVNIEFRYKGVDYSGKSNKSTVLTIGIFNDVEEAILKGNDLLIDLESKYKMHVYPSGATAKKERFSLNGGCFGSRNFLISNLAYLRTPFEFYAKITELKINPLQDVLSSINKDIRAYNDYKEEF